jgi:acyl-CoA reductase-like NAD-dependent aldehyde dehydrogenase
MTTLLEPLDLRPGESLTDEVPFWIGGAPTRSVAGEVHDDVSPSTGEVLARVHVATRADVDRAVEAAKGAQPAWARLPIAERARRLAELGRRVSARSDEFGMLDSRDGGTALRSMTAGAAKGGNLLGLVAGVAPELHGRTIPATPNGLHFTEPEPWGIVGAICAYNHPTLFTCMKIAAALAAGNAVILKPAVQTPLSPLVVAALSDDLLPPGVLNVLTGGAETGEAIVTHPDIPRLSFTGSMPTGLRVYAAAAQSGRFKSVTLELGGKNPIVIYPDVDPETAAAAVIKGTNFARVGGQSCGATSRLLLHESLHEHVLERVVADTRAIRLGMPDDPDTEMGCMVSHQHRDRVVSMMETGEQDGARLLTGGGPPAGRPDLEAGAFVEPTVFDRVDPSARIFREEIFGPVLSVTIWTDEREALRLANDSEYGLTASVWCNDVDRAINAARSLDVGYVWVNDVEVRYPGVPFGGWKQSGLGLELGLVDDILSHTRSKSINVGLSPRPG